MKMTAAQLRSLHIENSRLNQYLIHEAGKHPEKTILPQYIYKVVQEVQK